MTVAIVAPHGNKNTFINMSKHHFEDVARRSKQKHYIPLHRKNQSSLFWFYVASELTDDWTGWKRPISWGSDLQNSKSYATVMIRLPFNRYVIIRLWRLKDVDLDA